MTSCRHYCVWIICIAFILLWIGWLCVYSYRNNQPILQVNEPFNIIPPFPIDVVITYVDLNDNAVSNKLSKEQQQNIARFESNSELLYNLRSVEKHMGFVQTIYLVISDDQAIPSFLSTTHYQLQFIRHSQMIPSIYLPTYNSTVIENYIHKIPGLSEHYLYLNDDWFILRPCYWYNFFTPQGLPILSRDCEAFQQLTRRYWIETTEQPNLLLTDSTLENDKYTFPSLISQNDKLLDILIGTSTTRRTISQHVPQAMKVSFMNELDTLLSSYRVNDNSNSLLEYGHQYKYRHNYNLARVSLIHKYYAIHFHQCLEKRFSEYDIIITSGQDKTASIRKLLDIPHTFLNVHNEGSIRNEIYLNNYRELSKILGVLFSHPASFECNTLKLQPSI